MKVAKHTAAGISIPHTNKGEYLIKLNATELKQLQFNLWLAHKSSGCDEVAHTHACALWELINKYHNDTSELLSFGEHISKSKEL